MIRTRFFCCVTALALMSTHALAGGPASGVGIDANAYKDAQAKDQGQSNNDAQLAQLNQQLQNQEQQVAVAQAAYDQALHNESEAHANIFTVFGYGSPDQAYDDLLEDLSKVSAASGTALLHAQAAAAQTQAQIDALNSQAGGAAPADDGGQGQNP
jgi:hypothetical protein